MQDYFYQLADQLFAGLQGKEQCLLGFEAEESDFVRLNHNRLRQPGYVVQRSISIELVSAKRHARASVELTGQLAMDKPRLLQSINQLREQLAFLPDDPYLNIATEVNNTDVHHDGQVVDSGDALEQIISTAGDLDLVGLFANGMQYSGYASSNGQRNWHSSASFNFDWSCYLDGDARDKAVKSNYAGFDWQLDALSARLDDNRQQLEILQRPSKTIAPGDYRAWLSPTALSDIVSMMCWGGFGLKSHRTKNTPLLQMVEQGRHLHESVSLREHAARGLAPVFTGNGFIKPDEVRLIDKGQFSHCLVSARSGSEYGETVNTDWEYPGSLDMAAGELKPDAVISTLDTGLYINNLWYLNFTDRNNCQLTGMTRFACFWVENGEIVAPVNVMRFDDSVYNMLGSNLLDLGSERDMMLDPGTYGSRSSSSMQLPGALVADMRLTL